MQGPVCPRAASTVPSATLPAKVAQPGLQPQARAEVTDLTGGPVPLEHSVLEPSVHPALAQERERSGMREKRD